jgi:hypothetical protein
MVASFSDREASPATTPATTFATRRWRLGGLGLGLVVASVLAAALPARAALVLMYDWWLGSPEYSHGIIIPFISAYLIWRRRDELARLEFLGSSWGPVLALAGLVLEAAGELAAVFPLVQYAFLVAFYGIVLDGLGGVSSAVDAALDPRIYGSAAAIHHPDVVG